MKINLLQGIVKLIGVKRAERIMVMLIRRDYKKRARAILEPFHQNEGRER